MPKLSPENQKFVDSFITTYFEKGRVDYSIPPDWFHEGQIDAWNAGGQDIAVIAGFQSGKTAEEVYWLLREIQRCAPFALWLGSCKAIFAGPTLELLNAQAIPAFRELFEEENELGRFISGGKPKFHFSPEGATKIFGFSDVLPMVSFAYTNDSSNLESMTACCGAWDEAGQKENKKDSFRAYNRRLEIARATTFGQMQEWILKDKDRTKKLQWWLDTYFVKEGPDATFGRRFTATTPYEWNWFKVEIYDKADDPNISVFSFPTWLNPRNDKQRCFDAKLTMPLWEWEMMYCGLFTRPAGQIFDCFDDQVEAKDAEKEDWTNVCKPFDIPYTWTQRFSGHDFGPKNTAAVFLARNPKTGRFYLFRSYKAGDRTIEEHADNFRDRARLPAGVMNIACGGAPSEDGYRIDYAMEGWHIAEPPTSQVKEGINRLYSLIKLRMIVVFDDLLPMIDEIKKYSFELDDDDEPLADPKKIVDKAKYHRLDALRYIASLIYELFVNEGLSPDDKDEDGNELAEEEQTDTVRMKKIYEGMGYEEDERDRLSEYKRADRQRYGMV